MNAPTLEARLAHYRRQLERCEECETDPTKPPRRLFTNQEIDVMVARRREEIVNGDR